jgi:predicted dehydrogenase
MKKFRLGIVGSGYIARFHMEAFSAIGHKPQILISSDNSLTAHEFAEKYSIKKVVKCSDFFNDKKSTDLDGLIIACNTEHTSKYINWSQQNKIWTLAEKPISYDLETIRSFLEFKLCIVGFNRRYYTNIKYLRSQMHLNTSKKLFIDMNLPERTNESKLFGASFNKVFSNCVHGIDLLHYICGKLNIDNIQKILGNGSRIVNASNQRFEVRINFLINSPTNFSIKVYGLNEFYDLTPFELLTIYNKLEINYPTREYPVARYLPKVSKVISAISDEKPDIKPGFLEQAKAFILCVKEGRKNQDLPDLSVALNAQSFIQTVFKDLI